MKAKHYLFIFIATCLVFLSITAGITLLIDPLGISPIQLTFSNINAYKIDRTDKDRVVKKIDVLLHQPRTIVFGTSRIKQALNPQSFAKTPFSPAYNGGINNGSLAEQYQFLHYALRVNKQFHYAFIELFPHAILINCSNASLARTEPFNTFTVKNTLQDITASFLSYSALSNAYLTIKANKEGQRALNPEFSNGFLPLSNETNTGFSVLNAPNGLFMNQILGNPLCLDSNYQQMLKKIVSLCKKNKLDCKFIITPLHSHALYGLYLADWPHLMELKRQAAQLLPTYDFAVINPLTEEVPQNPMRYWLELNHFSPALGEKIIADLTTDKPKWAQLLNAQNIEQHLTQQTEALAHWKQGPLIAEGLKRAKNNLSAEKKTDAQLTAHTVTLTNRYYSITNSCHADTSSFQMGTRHYYWGNLVACADDSDIDSILFFVTNTVYYQIKPNITYALKEGKISACQGFCTFFYGLEIPTTIAKESVRVLAIRKKSASAIELIA